LGCADRGGLRRDLRVRPAVRPRRLPQPAADSFAHALPVAGADGVAHAFAVAVGNTVAIGYFVAVGISLTIGRPGVSFGFP